MTIDRSAVIGSGVLLDARPEYGRRRAALMDVRLWKSRGAPYGQGISRAGDRTRTGDPHLGKVTRAISRSALHDEVAERGRHWGISFCEELPYFAAFL
jgi:hypothetical protein